MIRGGRSWNGVVHTLATEMSIIASHDGIVRTLATEMSIIVSHDGVVHILTTRGSERDIHGMV